MARKKADKPITKTEFLRKTLGRNPNHGLASINHLWERAGHPGEISGTLYYNVRHELGIKSEWFRGSEEESSRPPRPEGRQSSGPVYQLKITLRDVRPPIWRRIRVPDCSLEQLHGVIQVAMGWGDCHLYSFDFGAESYTDPESARELELKDATRARLGDVVAGEKTKFGYLYDFGDHWDHDVLVEKVLPPGEGASFPQCLTGKRACPPDDVGGAWGYLEFLETIQGPKNERRKELLEWAGGEFDPEELDLDAVNARLRGM